MYSPKKETNTTTLNLYLKKNLLKLRKFIYMQIFFVIPNRQKERQVYTVRAEIKKLAFLLFGGIADS